MYAQPINQPTRLPSPSLSFPRIYFTAFYKSQESVLLLLFWPYLYSLYYRVALRCVAFSFGKDWVWEGLGGGSVFC